jgi:hypothetical protein
LIQGVIHLRFTEIMTGMKHKDMPGQGGRLVFNRSATDRELTGSMVTPAPCQPFIYVCIVSEFNLAELEACLTLYPQHLVLVVSSFDKAVKAAERLQCVLKERLPAMQIHRPDQQRTFGGEDLLELQTWIASTLRPCIDAIRADSSQATGHEPLPMVLNATGGTKAMSMVLLTRLPLDEVHYKGMRDKQLQRLRLVNNEWVSRGQPEPLNTALPLDVANLYADKVEVQPLKLANAGLHSGLAEDIWSALVAKETGIELLFGWLDDIWSKGRANPDYKQDVLTLHLPVLMQTPPVYAWIDRLAALDTSCFVRQGQQLQMPGNKPKGVRDAVRKWISGDWLEQLTHQWLLEAGVGASEMARGVVVNPQQQKSSDGDREADLFVHHKGRSYLIEIKADLPPETPEKSIDQQLDSMGDRFGKTTKVLMVGPHFRATLESRKRWDKFATKLAINDTCLCDSRESLLKALGLL